MTHRVGVSAFGWFLVTLLAAGCEESAPATPGSSVTVRLVELFRADALVNRLARPAQEPPGSEWRFDGPGPRSAPAEFPETRGWEGGPQVAGLTIKDGHLVGRSTGDYPLLRVQREIDPQVSDVLHALEVRMRVSAGTNLDVTFRDTDTVDLSVVPNKMGVPFDALRTPIVAGDEMRTYTLRTEFQMPSADLRQVIIRPTDVAGAEFEIESVRLILRKEHLAGDPSGVAWYGLSEIYRESLVARSGEEIRLRASLPRRPWLDLAVGTIEDGPVTFRLHVNPSAGASENTKGTLVLERTVTTPDRWETTPIDLSAFAGRAVTFTLSLQADEPGRLGVWGAPVIRSNGALPPSNSAVGDPPQGVILIWADTLRRDHLEVYGYPRRTSPVLGKMASQGALFRDCFVQATWTKVSTPSLLTGLYPTTHAVTKFADRLPASATTMAEVFRDAGYATLSLSSILFTGKFTNLHQGFEEVHESASLADRESSMTSREYVDRLGPWLDAHREVPFFVFLHVSDPHDPYEPYAPYNKMWADPGRKKEHERQAKAAREVITDPLMKRFGMPNREELKQAGVDPDRFVAHERDWYDGSIRAMDAELGRLFEQLRNLGLAEKTLVVFTADHGEEFLDHGQKFHGQSVYGELSHMPLIMWQPGAIPAGLDIEETVENIDLMPTILEMCGLPLPDAVQGRSLLPLLRRDRTPGDWFGRPAITEKAAIGGADPLGPPPRGTESYAIVLEGWKLIHNVQRPDGKPEFELYDHRNDPLDQTDLAAEHPDVVARLTDELAAWRKLALAARLQPDDEATKDLSTEDLERLRSLGYIQ